MKFRNSLLLSILLASTAALADARSVEEAQTEALRFLSASSSARQFAPSSQNLTLCHTIQQIDRQEEAAYLFQIGEADGYVLVSADDNTLTILGYSDDGHFDATNIPDNMQVWLRHYAEEITWAATHGVRDEGTKHSALPKIAPKKASGSPIAPLLGNMVWNQGRPFWNQCPYDSNDSRSYTGCVATATAQVMGFWKYPQTGQGSHSYTWTKSNGTSLVLSADFGNTTYEWENMLDNYNGSYTSIEANAVATLMYHLGVATDMDYSSNGSGTQTELAAQAMFNYFGYDKSLYAVRPDFVGFDSFEEQMLGELQAQRPVLMSGSTENREGHAFVCDGFDGAYFHINWGWGGSQNGYFALSALDPDEQGMGGAASGQGFHVGILGVMGIMPDQGGELSPVSLGTLGLKLQANKTIRNTDTFTIQVNQIHNSGISNYEGGGVGLAILDKDGYFVDWFYGFWCDGLPVGYYYGGEYDFAENLASVTEDGDYQIVPVFTDLEETMVWLMDTGFGTPECIPFTKSGNTITFQIEEEEPAPDPEYSLSDLVAWADGSTIKFTFESDAPYFHVKLCQGEEVWADDYINFKNVSISNVPAATWTVWVCNANANKQDVGEPLTADVTVQFTDYNVYNLTAYSEGSTIHFSFESDAPKFHVKVFNATSTRASAIIDFKYASLLNVEDGEWTIWIRPCDYNEEYYLADAVETTVTVSTAVLHTVFYFAGNELLHQDEVKVGTPFELWTYVPDDESLIFNGWIGERYETMPDHDISYYADLVSGIDNIHHTGSIEGIYTLSGKKVNHIQSGLYIIRMNDGSVTKRFIR